MATVSVFDVAKYILKKMGEVSAMRLQTLVYYSEAWSRVWEDRPLFRARIEAWLGGPVIPVLFRKHRGKFSLKGTDFPSGDAKKLNKHQASTVDAVIEYYGKRDSQWLSDLTHMEEPWQRARAGVPHNERGNSEITRASMQEYYSSLK